MMDRKPEVIVYLPSLNVCRDVLDSSFIVNSNN